MFTDMLTGISCLRELLSVYTAEPAHRPARRLSRPEGRNVAAAQGGAIRRLHLPLMSHFSCGGGSAPRGEAPSSSTARTGCGCGFGCVAMEHVQCHARVQGVRRCRLLLRVRCWALGRECRWALAAGIAPADIAAEMIQGRKNSATVEFFTAIS